MYTTAYMELDHELIKSLAESEWIVWKWKLYLEFYLNF